MVPPGVLFVASLTVFLKKVNIVHTKYVNTVTAEVKIYDARMKYNIFLEKYMWKSSFFSVVTRFKPATILKKSLIKLLVKYCDHRFT